MDVTSEYIGDQVLRRLQRTEQVLEHALVYLRDKADGPSEFRRIQALLVDLRETKAP